MCERLCRTHCFEHSWDPLCNKIHKVWSPVFITLYLVFISTIYSSTQHFIMCFKKEKHNGVSVQVDAVDNHQCQFSDYLANVSWLWKCSLNALHTEWHWLPNPIVCHSSVEIALAFRWRGKHCQADSCACCRCTQLHFTAGDEDTQKPSPHTHTQSLHMWRVLVHKRPLPFDQPLFSVSHKQGHRFKSAICESSPF